MSGWHIWRSHKPAGGEITAFFKLHAHGWTPWTQTLETDLIIGRFLGNILRSNTHEREKKERLGKGRSWTAMQLQQRPQPTNIGTSGVRTGLRDATLRQGGWDFEILINQSLGLAPICHQPKVPAARRKSSTITKQGIWIAHYNIQYIQPLFLWEEVFLSPHSTKQ